jgi:peptide alpha-N-acetyltransferase
MQAYDQNDNVIGAIVNKLEPKDDGLRGYIAMLAVAGEFRHFGIGSDLVSTAIRAMYERGCTEVVLETEIVNVKAMSLYLKLGFLKDRRLTRYYFNG